MTLVDLAGHLAAAEDEQHRWRLITEFLEEHRHEPADVRPALLADEPPGTGDVRWDVFLAALAEHLATRDERGAPAWGAQRRLEIFWFPFNSAAARVDAVVHAPASFGRLGERLQRRGVVGDVYVIGGAAMALAYDARRATRDAVLTTAWYE